MSDIILPETGRSAGIVTTAELLAAGKTTNQIWALAKRGTLVRLGRGVYADAAETGKYADRIGGDQLLRAVAALALVGSDATVSHESAATLYDIALLRGPGKATTLTCPPHRERRPRAGTQVRIARLPAGHVNTKPFPITTPARTVIDLARTLDFRAGVVAADCALHKKLTTKDELQSVVASCTRWRGVQNARKVVLFADGRAESPLESISRVLFADCGFPPPDLQVWLTAEIRVDFYWKRYRTVAEVDGDMKYDLDPARARAQLERDRLLRREGFEVVHFTWDEVTTQPQVVAATIRQAFARGTGTRVPVLTGA